MQQINSKHSKFICQDNQFILCCTLTHKQLLLILIKTDSKKQNQHIQDDQEVQDEQIYYRRTFRFRNNIHSDNQRKQIMTQFNNYQQLYQAIFERSKLKMVSLHKGFINMKLNNQQKMYALKLTKMECSLCQQSFLHIIKIKNVQQKEQHVQIPSLQRTFYSIRQEQNIIIDNFQTNSLVSINSHEASRFQSLRQAVSNHRHNFKFEEIEQTMEKIQANKSNINRMKHEINFIKNKILNTHGTSSLKTFQNYNPQRQNQKQDIIINQTNMCTVCLQDIQSQDNKTFLICCHDFHTLCIQKWLKYQNYCPICKSVQDSSNVNRLSRFNSQAQYQQDFFRQSHSSHRNYSLRNANRLDQIIRLIGQRSSVQISIGQQSNQNDFQY